MSAPPPPSIWANALSETRARTRSIGVFAACESGFLGTEQTTRRTICRCNCKPRNQNVQLSTESTRSSFCQHHKSRYADAAFCKRSWCCCAALATSPPCNVLCDLKCSTNSYGLLVVAGRNKRNKTAAMNTNNRTQGPIRLKMLESEDSDVMMMIHLSILHGEHVSARSCLGSHVNCVCTTRFCLSAGHFSASRKQRGRECKTKRLSTMNVHIKKINK